jgi:hypothetical protein
VLGIAFLVAIGSDFLIQVSALVVSGQAAMYLFISSGESL